MMRKQYTAAFKAKVVRELLKEEKTIAQIAAEYEVHPTQLKNWRAIALERLLSLFEKQDSTVELKAAHEEQITDLYAEIGKLTTQVAWLKKVTSLTRRKVALISASLGVLTKRATIVQKQWISCINLTFQSRNRRGASNSVVTP